MYDYNFVNFEFDSNGDGYPDSYVEAYDSNGDGNLNSITVLSDTNLNGNYDSITIWSDSNGDGYMETNYSAADTNNSGHYDTSLLLQDTTGDGMADLVQKAYDYNQDGQIDSITTYYDTNHDGLYDNVTKAFDSTGDGVINKMDHYVDADGTGHANYHEVYSIDPSTGQLVPAMAAGFEVGGTVYTELEHFHANEDYPDGISGDPKESMTYWECQGNTKRCALYSQKFVIEELSPNIQNLDIEEFAQVAKEHGWFTEDGGTTFLNMNNMLDYYGIENVMTFHNSINDIEECLNNGGKVIVSIDSSEIWYGADNNIFAPESSSNHAVEVIGIDRTNPEHPMVILNDSGTPYGCGEMIPLDVFEGAWEDGDCQMIKCYPSK
jgi:hypothetical protein